VSAPVVELVDRTMARDPGQRPQSMAELARQIREVELVLSMTPAPVLLAPPVPEVRDSESLTHEKPLVLPGRLRALARSWRWLLPVGAVVGALALLLVVRGNARAPVRGRADATDQETARVPSLVSLDAAAAPDTQGTSDADEPDGPEIQGRVEPAPAEETPKREASPRPKATHISSSLSQAESRQLLLDGRELLRGQRFDEARAAFERLLHAGKSRGPALVGLAKIAFQQHEYQEAVDRAREGAQAGGGAEARVVLGDAYFRLEKFVDARKAYEDALKLDPDNRTARQNLDLLERRGN
jgi:tetratricopeptide (TPR) repeat protein